MKWPVSQVGIKIVLEILNTLHIYISKGLIPVKHSLMAFEINVYKLTLFGARQFYLVHK